MATRAEPQIISYRARDINTSWRFARYLFYSTTGHITLLVALFAISSMAKTPPIFVPGYKVNLVTPKELKPSSLLDPEPKKKTTKRTIKTKQKKKKKRKSSVKKIVPKKTKPKPKVKEEPKKTPEVVKHTPDTKTVVPTAGQKAVGEEFEFVWYLKMIERGITQNWVTHGIDLSGYKTLPTVQFTLMVDGSVEGIKMLRYSGSRELDESVITAVRKATPFPALPEGYPAHKRLVYFSFDYKQERYE